MYNHTCYFSYISITIKCTIQLYSATSEFIEVKCDILKQFFDFLIHFTNITLNKHTKVLLYVFGLATSYDSRCASTCVFASASRIKYAIIPGACPGGGGDSRGLGPPLRN